MFSRGLPKRSDEEKFQLGGGDAPVFDCTRIAVIFARDFCYSCLDPWCLSVEKLRICNGVPIL